MKINAQGAIQLVGNATWEWKCHDTGVLHIENANVGVICAYRYSWEKGNITIFNQYGVPIELLHGSALTDIHDTLLLIARERATEEVLRDF